MPVNGASMLLLQPYLVLPEPSYRERVTLTSIKSPSKLSNCKSM